MSYLRGVADIINDQLLDKGKVIKGEADCLDIKLKGSYTIIRVDIKELKDNVFGNIYKSGSARSISDYVIVSDNVILVCELKSNNEGKMKTQLKNTGKFVRYLLEMVGAHSQLTTKVPPIKYVLFSNIKGGQKGNSNASKLSRINWEETELFRLSCNAEYHLNQFN
jgi:Holliday junction resolvase